VSRNCICLPFSPTILNAEAVPLPHNPVPTGILIPTVRGNVVPFSLKIFHFLENSGVYYPLTQHHIPEGWNRQQHRIEDFKPHKPESFYNKFYIVVLGEFALISTLKSQTYFHQYQCGLWYRKSAYSIHYTDYSIKKHLSANFFRRDIYSNY
jgi:hypothetical protein